MGLVLTVCCFAMTGCMNHCQCYETSEINNQVHPSDNEFKADSLNIDTREDDCALLNKVDTIVKNDSLLIVYTLHCE